MFINNRFLNNLSEDDKKQEKNLIYIHMFSNSENKIKSSNVLNIPEKLKKYII